MTEYLIKSIYWGFLMIVCLPLLISPSLFLNPELSKALVFRIIIELILIVYIALIIKDKSYLPKASPLLWAIIAFWTVSFLSTILSLQPYLSFWGEQNRAGGFFALSHYIIFFLIGISVLNKNQWHKILNLAIIISAIAGIYAILQKFSPWTNNYLMHLDRPQSTIGNVNFFAAYLLLLIFPTIYFLIKTKKWFYFIILPVQLFALCLTQTRGAYLGFLTGLLFFLFFYPSKKYYLKVSSVILACVVLASFWLLIKSDSKSPVLARIAQIAEVSNIRLITWQISLQAIKARPLLGYGPENFSIGLDQNYDPELATYGTQDTWWDKAHNFVFDYGITIGILGLLAYLSIFGAVLWKSHHIIKTTVAAYFVQNIFNFDSVVVYIILFLILAYAENLRLNQS